MRSQDDQLHDLIAEQAAEWYVAGSEGDFSPQQARDFMRWLRTSPAHVAEYLNLTRIANELAEVAGNDSASLADLLSASQSEPIALNTRGPNQAGDEPPAHPSSPRIYRSTRRPHREPRDRSFRPLVALGWAVALVVAAVLVTGGLATLGRTSLRAPSETLATRHGEVRSFHLSDGTFLQLDSDSAVAVRFGAAYRTVVVERGQVYFKVIRDSGRPFRVHVGQIVIRDIGTAFDVYRHASDTTVTVAQGKVRLWSVPAQRESNKRWLPSLWPQRTTGQPVADLSAGEQATLTPDGQVLRLDKVDVQHGLAWRQGRISFDERTVASVAAEFNRYNGVQVEITDPAVAKIRITGTFDVRDVQSFATFLGSLPNVTVERAGSLILVKAAPQHR